MTDAKPATDMPTLEMIVKDWRASPCKPATDDQIEAIRARLKIEEEYEMPSWSRNSVAILIARIDAERAARLAAEARVKVLEDALRLSWDFVKRAGAKVMQDNGNGTVRYTTREEALAKIEAAMQPL